MVSRRLDTHHEPVVCSVCARSLLRGEHASAFLDDGNPRQVCELCTARAMHYGWLRAGVELPRSSRVRGDRGRSIVGRWRSRSQVVAELPDEESLIDEPVSYEPEPVAVAHEIHAVPMDALQRSARALEHFNHSEHPRTIAGVARSLGAPAVSVNPSAASSAVDVIVAWELCWYHYNVDLEDVSAAVRLVTRGDELSELDGIPLLANATADDRGELTLAPTAG